MEAGVASELSAVVKLGWFTNTVVLFIVELQLTLKLPTESKSVQIITEIMLFTLISKTTVKTIVLLMNPKDVF